MNDSLTTTRQALGNRGLVRSDSGRLLGGVCAGIAHRTGTDPWVVRLTAILFAVFIDPMPVLYVILWILMPKQENVRDAQPVGALPTVPTAAPVVQSAATHPEAPQYPTDAAAQSVYLTK